MAADRSIDQFLADLGRARDVVFRDDPTVECSQMKIISIIDLAGHVYQVGYDDDMAAEDNLFGSINYRKQTITIDSGTCQQQKESTFLHEVFEGLNWHYKIGLEHEQIELLEAAWYQFLKANPGVLKGF